MKVLVACEESQAVTIELRRLGHEAYSCDIIPCSGGHPEWHLQQDVIPLLAERWDMIIAFPPCTYLTAAGAVRLFNRDGTVKDPERYKRGEAAAQFFDALLNADCPRVAVENPVMMKCFGIPTCDVPDFSEGYRDYETAIVQLRSKFMPGEGVDYLLDLLSRISKENGVTTRDNGVSQEVEARQGVSLKSIVQVKPRVKLCPFRTFLEVQQPESEFILRLDEDGNVGLFEADGGMWRMTAKERICAFFEDKLAEEVSGGKVIVMM